MDPRFSSHNLHLESVELFAQLDPSNTGGVSAETFTQFL